MDGIRSLAGQMMRGRNFLRMAIILGILALAAYLRIVSAQQTVVEHPIRNDALQYVAYAANMQAFNVYSSNSASLSGATSNVPKPDALRPPGYPLFLRGSLRNSIDSQFVYRVVMLQAWIGIGVVALAIVLAMQLLGYWPGAAVGLAVAVSPHMIIFTDYLLTETLYSFAVMVLLMIGVLVLTRASGRTRLLLAWLSGICLAAACLIRPTLDQFALVLLLLGLLIPSIRGFRREIVALAIGWTLLMAPWWIRNESEFGYASNPSLMVQTVHQGSYPDFMLDGRIDTEGYPYSHDPRTKIAESSLSAALDDVGRKFAEHPGRMLYWYAIEKPFYFFKWTLPDGWGDMFTYPILRSPWLTNPGFILLTSLVHGLHWPLVLLGMLGAILAFTPLARTAVREGWLDSLRWLAFVQIFVIAVHVAGAPYPRYSVPFRPLLFLLALFAIVVIARWLQQKKQHANSEDAADRGRRAIP